MLAEFIPTQKNAVASGFLPSAWFERDLTSGKWSFDLGASDRVPQDYVHVEETEE